jgi:hypothetical protein
VNGLLARATNALAKQKKGARWKRVMLDTALGALAVSGQTRIHLESSARGAFAPIFVRFKKSITDRDWACAGFV